MVKQLEEQRNGVTRVSQLPMYIHKTDSDMRPYRFRRDYSINGKKRIVTFGYYRSLEEAMRYYDDNLKASDHFALLAQDLRDAQQKLKLYEELFQPGKTKDNDANKAHNKEGAVDLSGLDKLNEGIELIQRNQKFIAEKLLGNILGGDLQ